MLDSLKTLVLVAVMGYLVVVAAAWLFQRALQYFPDTRRIAPDAVGLAGVAEVEIATNDGETLVAWHAPARPGQPTVLYLHGNGGAIWARADRVKQAQGSGMGMLLVSYRGYGGSSGKPSEQGLAEDARAAADWLAGRGVAADDTIYYGESIGAAVAIRLAAERPPAALVLEAPFTSAVDVGRAAYPFLPVNWLMKDRFDSMALIGKIDVPLLVLQGEHDDIVPPAMSRRLFEAAPGEPKRYLLLPGAGHSLAMTAELWGEVEAFVAGIR